jgi:hypothetical protein
MSSFALSCLSRTALALSVVACSTPAAAQRLTAERALENYRRKFVPTAELDCPRGGEAGEIVVCGRGSELPDPYRLPLPSSEPGDRQRLIAGEAGRGDVGHGEGRYCFTRCGDIVGLDIQTTRKLIQGVKRLLEGDE